MVLLAVVLARGESGRPPVDRAASPALVGASDRSHPPCGAGRCHGCPVGTRLQGRVSEPAARHFFAALFLLIGVTFPLAFTVFGGRFA